MSTHETRLSQAAMNLSPTPTRHIVVNTVYVSTEKWLDLTDALPEHDTDVLLRLTHGRPVVAYLCEDDGHWYDSNSDQRLDLARQAVAWMPLPELPPDIQQKIDAAKQRERDRLAARLAAKAPREFPAK